MQTNTSHNVREKCIVKTMKYLVKANHLRKYNQTQSKTCEGETKWECTPCYTSPCLSCQQVISTTTFGSTQTKENFVDTIKFLVRTIMSFCFSEILACFALLKHPFWDSPFCLIPDGFHLRLNTPRNDVKNLTLSKHANILLIGTTSSICMESLLDNWII